MDYIISAVNLSKNYSGKQALKDINLNIETGKIVGLLGPNGSGKTTFMKLAAGLLRPSSGKIQVLGLRPGTETKSFVSYLSDKNFLPKWMKIKDALDFYEDFYNDFERNKAEELIEFMGLNLESKVTSLSKGMTEKLSLSLTISRKAKLYILDEPLDGVDPTAREKIIDTIIKNFREDSTIIISTHQVSVMEKLFDDVIFISQGTIPLMGSAEDLRNERGLSIDELFREVFK